MTNENNIIKLLLEFRRIEKELGVKIETASIEYDNEMFTAKRYNKEYTEYTLTGSKSGYVRLAEDGSLCTNEGRCLKCGRCM